MLSKSAETSCLHLFLAYIDVSKVKLFVTAISFHTTTLAVLYLVFSYENLHFEYSMIGSYCANILGSNLVLVHEVSPSLGALLHPKKKQLFSLLWPCRSQNSEIPADCSLVRCMFFLRKYSSGCMVELGFPHLRFKSTPAKDDLELPIMTPSGFIIGTILTMFFCKMES